MQHSKVSRPISLLCIAASTDATLLAQWEKHLLPLQQAGFLTSWSDQHIHAGTDRLAELSAHLDQADCVIFLLSADFFADDTCLILIRDALLRQQKDRIQLIPLLVRPVTWQDSLLGTLTCLPANGIPIMTWEHPDEGWQSAVQGVRHLLNRAVPPSLSLLPLGRHTTTDRERMLRRLRRIYQTSLGNSLLGIPWMDLGLASYPDAVRNATHLLQRLPSRTERMLPVSTLILSVYDQAEEELLILGAPGAGKSTLLLHLALDLLTRAEADAAHPLAVIMPLSSWAISRPKLADWQVDQLAYIYGIPRALGQQWIQQRQILPLLDGLDEMEEASRVLCIAAINIYHAEQFTGLVVCSRREEYDTASIRERLLLQNAVVVQDLTQEQAVDVIHRGGSKLEGLRYTFTENTAVRELTTTPLMLSIFILAYRGTMISDLPYQQTTLEERVWADYIERMVNQKGGDRLDKAYIRGKRYSLTETSSWLSWLAQQMRTHNQTWFYGEYLQESWLLSPHHTKAEWLLVRIPAMLLGALTSWLLSSFLDLNNDVAVLCQIGLMGSFLGWCLSQRHLSSTRVPFPQKSRREIVLQRSLPRLLSILLFGLLVAATFGLGLGLHYHVNDWLRDGTTMGIGLSISVWLLQNKLAQIMLAPEHPSTQSMSRWSRLLEWIQTISGRQTIWTGVILGIGIGLSSGLSIGLTSGLNHGLSVGLNNGLTLALNNGLSHGLIFGLSAWLINVILDGQANMAHLAERIHWTGRTFVQLRHLWISLIVALVCFCFFGLCIGLSVGLFVGLSDWIHLESLPWVRLTYSLSDGLSNGLTSGLSDGLSDGLSCGLCYWMLIGLYQGVRQEHLEDQDRRKFNQGLHRSLYNTFLLSLLGAGIIMGISVTLHVGLTVGLNDWVSSELGALPGPSLSDVLSRWLSIWKLIALSGWLVIWAATGGLTILRHYLLRLLLAQSRTFPWNAQAFLDDATARILLRRVGGGYTFVHRRLLEYFAARVSSLNERRTDKIN